MTYAPATLLAAREVLIDNVPGLGGAEVGIVGDGPHARTGNSYHLGKNQLRSDSYTIVESSRDRNGLSDAASALDVGWFSFKAGGRTHTLRTFSLWLVGECEAGAPDTKDIREVIHSPDGRTVERWDRLERRSTGDDSHRSHTHISWFRDSEKRDKAGLFRRWLTEVVHKEDGVSSKDVIEALQSSAGKAAIIEALKDWTEENPDSTQTPKAQARVGGWIRMGEQRERERHAALLAAITGAGTDEQAVITGVLAGLTPVNVNAIPEETARRVMDLFAARLDA